MTSSISEFFESNFSDYKTTLKETSYDQANGEYTTELEMEAYNYDNIIKYSVFNSECLSCSQDAILINKTDIFFIEFKNTILEQKVNSNDKTMLRKYKLKFNDDIKNKLLLKGVEGLYIFKKIAQENGIRLDGVKFKYILCYNENKNYAKKEELEAKKILDSLRVLSKHRNISFGLFRLKHNIYYDEVLTLDRNAFRRYMLAQTD